LYVIFFLIALVVYFVALGSISIDDETARYAISTLVQSEAAILALVFSLSLIAMQQAASSYPPGVSKLFYKKNPIFLSTLIIYLVSILLGICVLIQIPKAPQGSIRFTFLVSIFALFSIFTFVNNTFNFLTPHIWIKSLRNNRKYGIFSVENKDCIHILGILLNSLHKSDYDAVKTGLDYFEDYKMEFIDFQKNIVVPLDHDKRVKFEKSLYTLAHYFVDVGELSLKMGSTADCTIKIIKNLYDIRKVADEYEMECVTSLTTESIRKLAKKAVCPLNYELNDKNPDNRECASFALGLLRNNFL
jgi:hypothetical protein